MSKNFVTTVLTGIALSLLTATPAPAAPSEVRHGDWVVGNGVVDGVAAQYVGVSNDSRSLFVIWCPVGEECSMRIVLDTSCDVNHEYTMLMSSSIGAAAVKIRCQGQIPSGEYRYEVLEPGATEVAVAVAGGAKDKGVVGFAIALDGGQFRALRFSLDGADLALQKLLQLREGNATVPNPSKNKTSTKNQLL